MPKNRKFTFYFSEGKMSDSVVRDLLTEKEGEEASVSVYKFSYTPPYEKDVQFIKKFQYRSAYKPFRDETQKRKIMVINVTDWIGHEREEKLEIFAMFLHDYHSFYEYEYAFMAEKTTREEIQDLCENMSEYLGRAHVVRMKYRDDKEAA